MIKIRVSKHDILSQFVFESKERSCNLKRIVLTRCLKQGARGYSFAYIVTLKDISVWDVCFKSRTFNSIGKSSPLRKPHFILKKKDTLYLIYTYVDFITFTSEKKVLNALKRGTFIKTYILLISEIRKRSRKSRVWDPCFQQNYASNLTLSISPS